VTGLLDVTHPPGEPWTHVLTAGQRLRITDLEGTQAVDTIFYNAADPSERYSSADTVRAQGGIFLTTGSVLVSNDGRAMLTVVEDSCGRHDTVGGACSAESNTCRFGHHTRAMHNCRDNFLVGLARHGLGKRDLVPNINFFMHDGRPPRHRRRHLPSRRPHRPGRQPGRAGRHLQLPAAQQPLQRLEPDPDRADRMGVLTHGQIRARCC
jgi:urea carboxylase-associated protein 1